MKVEKEEYTVVNIKLTLTRGEAAWLKATVQNPPPGITPETERSEDSRMRRAFWNALTEAGIDHA